MNKKNKKIVNPKSHITSYFSLGLIAFMMINSCMLYGLTVSAITGENDWNMKIMVTDESNTLQDSVIIGEKQNASQRKDSFDVPKPPPFQPPVIRASLPTSLDKPYDYLWEEYKNLNATSQQWNLSFLWFSMQQNQTMITLSWNHTGLQTAGYQQVELYHNDSSVADMLDQTTYQYQATSNIPTSFTIRCSDKKNSEDLNRSDDNVDEDAPLSSTPGFSFLAFVGIIVLCILILVWKKEKL